MSEFVRFYKECERYKITDDILMCGCKIRWKDIEMTTICMEQFGIRCPKYKRGGKV